MRRPCRQGQLHPFPPPKYETPTPNEALDPLSLLAHSAFLTLHRVRCLCQRIPFNSLQGLTKDLSALMTSSAIHPTFHPDALVCARGPREIVPDHPMTP